ncbi:MAG: type II toxin-antitoxin system ParD family antitoxin [Actinomycetota bacterium]
MDVTLPSQLEDFVRAQVRTGRYADAQEVVADALRRLREAVKAAEDPTVAGLLRDAIGLANQAQREVTAVLGQADRETSLLGDVVRNASALANGALDVARRVPGARGVERIVRAPLDGVTAAATQGEQQAQAMRGNLESTAQALGMLGGVLERLAAAGRIVQSVVPPSGP